MKNIKHIASNIFLLALMFIGETAFAQKDSTRLRQEVEVTKAYQPIVNEAVKINDIPQIKPEPTEVPTFNYSIFSKPIFSTFEPAPVAAAKMVGDPRPEMGNGLLKLGLGNYLTPYGELFYNARPGKTSIFGIHFKHLSSGGDIKLLNGDKVDAPNSVNFAEIFGKKFYKKSTLSGSVSYDRKAFRYYGYAGDELSDSLKEALIPTIGDQQYFSKGTVDVHYKSETLGKYDLNYDFGINTQFMGTKTGQNEIQTILSADLNKKFGKTYGILKSSITSYQIDSIMNNVSGSFGDRSQMLVRIDPSVKWMNENAALELGLNTAIFIDDDASEEISIWPKIYAEWTPVERVMTLFAGLDGYLQHNTYSNIIAENPYVDAYHDIENAEYKTVVTGGFKGKLTPKTNYVAKTSWSSVKNQHFYVLNNYDLTNPFPLRPSGIKNTFDWDYDDVNIFKLSGEVLHSVSDHFSLHLSGNYYSYDLKTLDQAWQMPKFDLIFSGIYKASEKLKFTADIFVVGSRTALIREIWSAPPTSGYGGYGPPYVYYVAAEEQHKMDPIVDLNAGAEYQFRERLNFFLKLNNFGFQKYEQWLGYTNKGFNCLLGASYKF